ncbi:MAG: M67 family metallopeptidase [Chloroflexota bacterium]
MLGRRHLEEMASHARSEAPNECCGVLAGSGDRVVRIYTASNAEASAERYSLPPRELFRIFKEVERMGWEVLGFYHSHTHTEAYPSATDRDLAFWPDSRYVIVSLKDPQRPAVRAFRIVDGNVTEDTVEVVQDS